MSVNYHFRKTLLFWYAKHHRDLPWRRTKDPYAVWLSEIMLQQTTVKTVVPYFERFLTKFPTLQLFAKSSEKDYLKLWQGLGYYNRIRNFHKAAQLIVEHYEVKIPSTKEELIKLPGLGDYTAAAVASIAFNEPVPVVDGNVMRVLARLFACPKDIQTGEAKKFFKRKACELLDAQNPGDFNQAMMELGATICSPKNPSCLLCPVQQSCQAFKKGNPEKFPIKKKKTIYHSQKYTCFVYRQGNLILLRQRQKSEIMAGLWELPLEEIKKEEMMAKENLKPVRHTIMNRRMIIYPVTKKSDPLSKKTAENVRWIPFNKLDHYPLSTITRKILRQLI